MTTSCTYLEHIVGNGRVKQEQAKLDAVKNFPILQGKKEVGASRAIMLLLPLP